MTTQADHLQVARARPAKRATATKNAAQTQTS